MKNKTILSLFANVNFMPPLPSEEINLKTQSAMIEFVEKYRPLRQWTVREETTKDKAGALPLAVYTVTPKWTYRQN